MWPDLTKLRHSGKTLAVLWRFILYWAKFWNQIRHIFMMLDRFSFLSMAQNSKYNLAIWSCCRPTVHIPPVIFSSFFCKISYKRRKYGKETAESNKTISDLNIAGCNKIRFFQGRLSEYNHWKYCTKIKLSSKDFEYIILFILIL